MERLEGADGKDVFGYRYTPSEVETALFATRLYRQLIERGVITPHPGYERAGVDLLAALTKAEHYMADDFFEISPEVHKFLAATPLRFLADLVRPMSAKDYGRLCERLQVDAADLLSHAATAQNIVR